MQVKETLWKKCLELIEKEILHESYNTWFSPTYPKALEDGLITIVVHNQFYRKCLIENYRELIETTLKVVTEKPILVDFCIESEVIAHQTQNKREEESLNREPVSKTQLSTSLNPN